MIQKMINFDKLKSYENELKPYENESLDEYRFRVCSLKEKYSLSWDDIAQLIKYNYDFDRNGDSHRCWFRFRKNNSISELNGTIDVSEESDENKLKKLKYKLSEERIQNNAILRRLSREETLKEIAKDCVYDLVDMKPLSDYSQHIIHSKSSKKGILCLSDWHYGLDISLFNNEYNPTIAKQRIKKLLDKVIEYINEDEINELYVLNLGDLISGRIHLTLRLNSRIDVITQTMQVCEILSEFLRSLSAIVKVHFYDCLDNHSRCEPNKKESLDLESFARLIPWWLKERLAYSIEQGFIEIHDNEYDYDLISLECNGFRIAGIHGHEDSPSQIVDNVVLYTHEPFDLICTAHRHHFSADEKNETLVIGNGTLMGTDYYAKKKHLSSTPSQNLIVVSNDNVVDTIHRIIVF